MVDVLRRQAELAIGGINAVLRAVVVAAVALAWFGSAALAGVFSLAVVLNLLASVFAGTVIPMGCKGWASTRPWPVAWCWWH